MANAKPSIPKYRRQKRPQSCDVAFVELNGKRHYLGDYNTPESKQRYHRLLAEWSANGGRLVVDAGDITIVELCAAFWAHAQQYYRKPDGEPTSTLSNFAMALRHLKDLYGRQRAADFGPLELKAVRQQMIDADWSRGVINQGTGILRSIVKWAVAAGLVDVAVHTALTTVAPLKRGRCRARETEPRKPVPAAHVDAVRPHVSRQVQALIDLQLLTGARGGELVVMRSVDVDTTGKVWLYRPTDHKTSHHGHERTIYIGPRGRHIVQRFMARRSVDAYLFSPVEAERDWHARATTHRHQPVETPRTDRTVGDRHTSASYRRAVERGCVVAGVPQWTPHRLRHSAGTNVRREYGTERHIVPRASHQFRRRLTTLDYDACTRRSDRVAQYCTLNVV